VVVVVVVTEVEVEEMEGGDVDKVLPPCAKMDA